MPTGLVLMAALFAGCFQTQWFAEGRTEEERRADEKICRAEAYKSGSAIRNIPAWETCMRHRGWARSAEGAKAVAAVGSGFCGRWSGAMAEQRNELLRQLAIKGVECDRACTAADELKLQLCLIDDLTRKVEAITGACIDGDDFAAGFLIGTLTIQSETRCFRPLRGPRLN